MNLTSFLNSLEKNSIKYKANEPMKNHTSFKTGGEADVFLSVKNRDELAFVLKLAKENDVPVFILGKGSNLLVSDKGIDGVVISLFEMSDITVLDTKMVCGSGVSLAAACVKARDNSLSGLEFAYGIPGTVGGAVYMNAGAYGGEISQVIVSAEVMDFDGNIFTVNKEDMHLGYRTSIFSKEKYIVLSVEFSLSKANKSDISCRMEELMSKRKEKQPLCFPSAGSTFKRPEGYFAGALIEKNNLKGFSIGGAMVSELHAGFVINYNKATTTDILRLIRHIQETVYKNDGVLLCTEVLFVGRTPDENILPYKTADEISA